MGLINIYNQELNTTYSVTIDLRQGLLSPELSTSGYSNISDVTNDVYLVISTNIPKIDGSFFPTFVIRSLSDVAPGKTTPSNWTDFINDYIDYFLTAAELGLSSSSSSLSSSSSSSVEYSTSSSSEIELNSTSSASSPSSESSSSN